VYQKTCIEVQLQLAIGAQAPSGAQTMTKRDTKNMFNIKGDNA